MTDLDVPVIEAGTRVTPVRGNSKAFETPEGAAAKEVADRWWEWYVAEKGYMPPQRWVAVFQIVRRLFVCGWTRREVVRGLAAMQWITIANMIDWRERDRRRCTGHAPRPSVSSDQVLEQLAREVGDLR
jgi:hypothetical protein